jgi:predicted AAA+ superfamily ATPase
MVLERQLFEKANILMGKYPMLVVTGPRQSGKTTFARQLRPDFAYLNMEIGENRLFAQNDPHGFLQMYKGGVILDEVQQAPYLFPYLQLYTDERGVAGEYILSGSQHFLLLEKITQSLAGRVAILELQPFSLQELAGSAWEPNNWEEILVKGFYPRVHQAQIEPEDFYPDYIQTYIERDVRSISNVGDLMLFRAFVSMCAGRIGQLINFSSIGNDLGIDGKTVKMWLSILETSFIAYRLPPYFQNHDKRLIKTPKLYFYDTGLAAWMLGIRNVHDLPLHFAKGALFENFVINEMRKNRLNKHQKPNFYFWQDKNANEIDLLIDEIIRQHAIEIKAGKTINEDFFKHFSKFTPGPSATVQNWVVYGGDSGQQRTQAQVINWKQLGQIG